MFSLIAMPSQAIDCDVAVMQQQGGRRHGYVLMAAYRSLAVQLTWNSRRSVVILLLLFLLLLLLLLILLLLLPVADKHGPLVARGRGTAGALLPSG